MCRSHEVAVVIGSLRSDSYSSRVARVLGEVAPNRLRFSHVEIGNQPLYNQDLDSRPPEPWATLRQSIRGASAVLFVTPEYNRSVPGVLKNAIDIASRPYGHSVFDAKPAAVVSQTPGALGGFGANHALRQSLVFLNMPTLQQPEVYLGKVGTMFDDVGVLTDEATRKFLGSFMQSFAAWIDLHVPMSTAPGM